MTEYRDLWDRLDHVLGKLEALSNDYARGMAVRDRMAQLENQLADLAEDIQLGFIERRKHSSRRAPRQGWAAAARRSAPHLVSPQFGRPHRDAALPEPTAVGFGARRSVNAESVPEPARLQGFGRN
jgi:hypothetical protein